MIKLVRVRLLRNAPAFMCALKGAIRQYPERLAEELVRQGYAEVYEPPPKKTKAPPADGGGED